MEPDHKQRTPAAKHPKMILALMKNSYLTFILHYSRCTTDLLLVPYLFRKQASISIHQFINFELIFL